MRVLPAFTVLACLLILGACASAASPPLTPGGLGTAPAATHAPVRTPVPAATLTDPAITLTIPRDVQAGKTFEAAWAGKETSGDFFVIVPAGAATWAESADSPYVNATIGNPAKLTAPKTPGAYEVWFLKGDTEGPIIVKARAPIIVKQSG